MNEVVSEMELKKHIRVRKSDVEKLIIAGQQTLKPVQIGKAFRITIDYNPERPMVDIKIEG